MLEDFRLKVFMAVLEKGNFTKAARALGISQPAVSQNIAELEKALGAELLSRSRGEVSLTSAGVAFKEYASRILHLYSSVETVFNGSGGRKTDILVASDPFASEFVLPDLLGRMPGAENHVSFRVVPEGGDGEADLRIWCTPHGGELSLEDSNSYICPVEAVAATAEGRGIRDLRALPPKVRLAVWEPYSSLLPFDLKARISVRAYSPSTVARLASSSPGMVAILPREAAILEGLDILPVSLPSLLMDLMAAPSGDFSGSQAYTAVRNLLDDLSKAIPS